MLAAAAPERLDPHTLIRRHRGAVPAGRVAVWERAEQAVGLVGQTRMQGL